MSATLREILLAPDTEPNVTADCLKLIEQEVSAMSGPRDCTVICR